MTQRSPLALTVRVAVRTDVGRARRRNEDAAVADEACGIAVVADGMGGHPSGDVASALAAEEALVQLRLLHEDLASGKASPGTLGARMAEAVRRADDRVRQAWRDDPAREGMGTTLTVLLVDPAAGAAVLGHVGDSRAYRLREGGLALLTRDQTWVQEQVDAGRLEPEQVRGHPYASVLSQALGLEEPAVPEVVEVSVKPGDVFLLCSDGLSGMLSDAAIRTILAGHLTSGLEEAGRALVDAANGEGGFDNITVALLAVDGA